MRHTMMRWAVLAAVLTSAFSAYALDQKVIEAGVNEKQEELLTCYDNAVERNEKLAKGKIITRYHIAETGKVTSAKIVRNDLKDKQLAACVRQVFLTLDYGEQEKPTNVTYPLDFN